jgi:pimeloyl-ACP methyl ester carboxylesterase
MTDREAEDLRHLQLALELSGLDVPARLPDSHHVVLGGMRLHYLDWGSRGRPPILFLHGGALTAHTWDVVCLALRDEFHCLALDQRGHGDSEWSPTMDYAPEAHLADIERFVDLLGLDRLILVGQSMGGLNAFVYAQHHAARLAALVIIDTGPGVRFEGARRIGDFVADTVELDSIDEFVTRAVAFNPHRDPRLLRRSLLNSLRRLPNGRWTRKNDTRHYPDFDVRELMRRALERFRKTSGVTCPTLVVRGAKSDLFLDEDAAEFAATLPDGRWARIEDAGHTVQGDNPRALVDVLRGFFADVAVLDQPPVPRP